jgi:hypothetical protein
MTEQDFARHVVRYLDAAAEELPPSTVQRLSAVREAAVARMQGRVALLRLADAREATAGPPGSPPTGSPLIGSPWPAHTGWFQNRRILVPLVTSLLIALAFAYWQQQTAQRVVPVQYSDFADVDAEVLTDELPVVAYLDPGFEIWLYHTPASDER